MIGTRMAFPTILAAGVLATFGSLCSPPTYGQAANGCPGNQYVGAEPSNPLTAELVTTNRTPNSAGGFDTRVMMEYVARDSRGRIRDEKRDVGRPPGNEKTVELETQEGKKFTVTREEFGTLIQIVDPSAANFVVIRPGMRIATATECKVYGPPRQPGRAYSAPYLPGPQTKPSPTISVERLDDREIQGFQVHGVKYTKTGTEEDGDWNGKPIQETELWISDDLAAKVLRIIKDLRTGSETRNELKEIKREEPDPALFEIPRDYELNPAIPGGMPIMRSQGIPRSGEQ